VQNPAPVARPGGIVAVLALGGVLASLMQTLVVPLIGELPTMLDTSSSNASWVLTVTLLSGGVSTPVVGRLGDLFGKRRMLLVSVGLLTLGSIVCALSNSLPPMVVGRGLQGMGMGVVPLGISTMRDVLPAERLGSAVALMSSSMGIGGALGLPIAAGVAQEADWHALFWGSAVLGCALAVLIWRLVPAVPPIAKGRFDGVGAIGLSIGLVSLLLAVSKGADWGWGSATTLGLFTTAVVVFLAWGWFELRSDQPLVDLRTTSRPPVLLTNIASVLLGFAMYAQALIVPQLLQLPESTGYGLGQSMLAAGLWLAPAGLVMMFVSPVGARISAARGPKVSLFVGAVIIAVGYGLAATVLMRSTWGLLLFSCLGNVGIAIGYGAMPSLIMAATPLSETAAANGFNALMRSVGTAGSAAVIGVVLAQMSHSVGGHTLPTEAGFRAGLVIGGGVAVIGALVTLAIPTPGAPGRPARKATRVTATARAEEPAGRR